jgi:hypothetical protein
MYIATDILTQEAYYISEYLVGLVSLTKSCKTRLEMSTTTLNNSLDFDQIVACPEYETRSL